MPRPTRNRRPLARAVPRPRPGHARRRRTAGFTLVELMVALLMGALVVAAIFSLGGASARHFQEQQRVGVTQRSVRSAMNRLRRDIARAGYLHVPDNRAPSVRMCPTPAPPRNLPAVWFDDDDTQGNAALAALNSGINRVSADRLQLIGSYAAADPFLVRDITGVSSLRIQTHRDHFRRSFVVPQAGGQLIDQNRFGEVFRAGRVLHIDTPYGHLFVTIVSASIDSLGQNATVNFTPALDQNDFCYAQIQNAFVTPLSLIEWSIDSPDAGSNLSPQSSQVTGANTQLIRRELDLSTGSEIAGTRRVVLDYAVDFNLDFVLDTAPPGNPPNIVLRDGAAAEGTVQAQPWQVRGVIASIAARTPEQDPRFPWPDEWASGRPDDQPLNRFRVFTDRRGAARVRHLRTEIQIPNMLGR